MESNEFFANKFAELGILKIEEDELKKDPKFYLYKDQPVELVYFNPERITYKTRFVNYIKYMKDVQNEYTVKNILGYSIVSGRHHIILEEPVELKTLAEFVKGLNFINKLRTILKLIKIIKHFHDSLNLTLKVLSTNNIFVDDKHIKLNVSNLKRLVQECSIDNLKKETLYYEYLPPDLFDLGNNDNVDGEIEYKTEGNIWSMGCIVSEIFSGFIPWYNKYSKNEIIIIKLLVKKTNFPIPDKIKEIDRTLYKLISECVNTDPKKRPSIDGVYKVINNIVENKENIYTLMLITNKEERYRGLGKKYLVSWLYKYF